MDVKQIARGLWRWGWLIVSSTVVAALCSYWATTRMPREYDTAATLFVGRSMQAANPTFQEIQISQSLAKSYVELARRRGVLQGTVDALGLGLDWEQLVRRVSAVPIEGTQLIEVRATDTDPLRAKQIADEVARQLILQSPTPSEREQGERRDFVGGQLRDLEANIDATKVQIEGLKRDLRTETSAAGVKTLQDQVAMLQQKINIWRNDYVGLLEFYRGSQTNYLSVAEAAALPSVPSRPRTWLNVLLAATVGLLLAALVALAVEYFDDTLKDKEDVERVLGLPTLGTVARFPGARGAALSIIALDDPFAPVTEAYRVARINIQFSTVVRGRSKSLLVTSATPGEGKTTTAANLGVVMAQAGRRVVLVDADLRRPSLHRVFAIANQQGLTTLLLDDALAAETALVETRVRGLFVLPSGPLPPNRAELLGSERMRTRLEQLTEIADAVILDSPPILAVADTQALGTLASGVILVADSERTRSELVRRGKEALEQVGLRLYGVILNKASARRAPAYAYEYAHGEQRSGAAGEASEAPTEAKRGLRTWLGWVRG